MLWYDQQNETPLKVRDSKAEQNSTFQARGLYQARLNIYTVSIELSENETWCASYCERS